MFPLMKESMSVHYPNFFTGLKYLTPISSQLRLYYIFLQCMNIMQGTKLFGQQWNRLLDAVVTIFKYKKNKIDHDIHIKCFSDETVSYFIVFTDDLLNTTTNETASIELIWVYKEHLAM